MYCQVTLVGRLGGDPDLRFTQNQTAVAKLYIATTESYTDKTTQQKSEKTQWHNVVAWGKLGENVTKYTAKGSLVFVTGRLEHREYQKQDGTKGYATEIVADQIRFLSSTPQAKPVDEFAQAAQGFGQNPYHQPQQQPGQFAPAAAQQQFAPQQQFQQPQQQFSHPQFTPPAPPQQPPQRPWNGTIADIPFG